MLKHLLLAMSLMTGAAYAQTQMELAGDACSEYKQADADLNSVYGEVLAKHKKDTAFAAKLKEAQRAWIKFRDAHLESIYPAANKQQEYGSAFPMCNCGELAEITKKRTAQLKQWLTAEEGDVCNGSRL